MIINFLEKFQNQVIINVCAGTQKENTMKNIPDVKIGIIAVSRDCFIRTLSQSRRERVVEEVRKKGLEIEEISIVVEN